MMVEVNIAKRPRPDDIEEDRIYRIKDMLYQNDVFISDEKNGTEYAVMAHIYHDPRAGTNAIVLDFSVTCKQFTSIKRFIGPKLKVTERLVKRMQLHKGLLPEFFTEANKFASLLKE